MIAPSATNRRIRGTSGSLTVVQAGGRRDGKHFTWELAEREATGDPVSLLEVPQWARLVLGTSPSCRPKHPELLQGSTAFCCEGGNQDLRVAPIPLSGVHDSTRKVLPSLKSLLHQSSESWIGLLEIGPCHSHRNITLCPNIPSAWELLASPTAQKMAESLQDPISREYAESGWHRMDLTEN